MNKTKEKTGWQNIEEWDVSAAMHSYPAWLPKLARAYLRTKSAEYACHSSPMGNYEAVEKLFSWSPYRNLFDHWGRRGTAKTRTLFTMPYNNDRATAELFAKELGLKLISKPNEAGAWHPSSYLYEFSNPAI